MLRKPQEIRAITLLTISYIGSKVDSEYLRSALLCASLFDATECFDAYDSLLKDELICVETAESREYCSITPKGNSILDDLTTFIPDGIREDFLRTAWRYYEALSSGIEYYSSIRTFNNGYYLDVGVKVNGNTTTSASVYFNSHKEALDAKKNCETRPQTVTNTILAAITGDPNYLV